MEPSGGSSNDRLWRRGCSLDPHTSVSDTIPSGGGIRISHRHNYHLEIGKETIVYFSNPVSMSKFSQFSNPLQHVSFFGKCYHCKYSAHSQKYCPLRYCKLCKTYGHSEMVCWLRNEASSEEAALSASLAAAEISAEAAEAAAEAAEAAQVAADMAADVSEEEDRGAGSPPLSSEDYALKAGGRPEGEVNGASFLQVALGQGAAVRQHLAPEGEHLAGRVQVASEKDHALEAANRDAVGHAFK